LITCCTLDERAGLGDADAVAQLPALELLETRTAHYIQLSNDASFGCRCINMASSSVSNRPPSDQDISSSSRSPPNAPTVDDEPDIDDPVIQHSRDQAVLSEDFLDADGADVVSFKRKQKQTVGSRFLSMLSGGGSGSRQQSTSPTPDPTTANPNPLQGLHTLGDGRDGSHNVGGIKDGSPLDWYVEGPGRRVGYEDSTAIDWIFEYTKERQRLRVLYSSSTGVLGYVRQFLDASQIWVLLILTGLASGLFAAAIDVASDWLGDIKTGFCSAGPDGGHFYLNKYFCCFGYDELSQCQDWVSWSRAFHITSAGGRWFIEYFFFLLFSVR
jgi:chloride channel 3/4/5